MGSRQPAPSDPPRWARNKPVVLHETAHAILDFHTGRQFASHGPEFATLLLDLFARYAKAEKGKARQMGIRQKPRRVRFATAAALDEAIGTPKNWVRLAG